MRPQPSSITKQITAARAGMKRRDFKVWIARQAEISTAIFTGEMEAPEAPRALPSRTERRRLMRLDPKLDLRLSGGTPHPQGSRLQRRRRSLTPDQHARLDREASRQRIADLRADGKPLPGQLTDPTFRRPASSRG